MNNKELTELKERFMSAYCEPNKLHHKWGYKLVDGEYYQYSPDDVWAWIELTVLPHLKSNDEIKREAVQEFMEYCWDGGEHDGWIISKADGYLETLTQKETQ